MSTAISGMAHSDCGGTCGCAGETVRSFENTCHTWALLRWSFTTKRRYIKCMHLYLYTFTDWLIWLSNVYRAWWRNLQSGGCTFESRPGLLRSKVYSAFHPSGVGKWVPVIAGKAKAGMAHSDCGWTHGCAGKNCEILWEHVPYLSASEVVFHEEALYQVYVHLPLPYF